MIYGDLQFFDILIFAAIAGFIIGCIEEVLISNLSTALLAFALLISALSKLLNFSKLAGSDFKGGGLALESGRGMGATCVGVSLPLRAARNSLNPISSWICPWIWFPISRTDSSLLSNQLRRRRRATTDLSAMRSCFSVAERSNPDAT